MTDISHIMSLGTFLLCWMLFAFALLILSDLTHKDRDD